MNEWKQLIKKLTSLLIRHSDDDPLTERWKLFSFPLSNKNTAVTEALKAIFNLKIL